MVLFYFASLFLNKYLLGTCCGQTIALNVFCVTPSGPKEPTVFYER